MARRPLTIVLTNDAKTIAGGENYVLYVAKGMRARGHRVIVAPLVGHLLEEVARREGYETVPVRYASQGREFAAARALVHALRETRPDIIHTNSNIDRTVGALAARSLRVGCVASIHSCLSIRHNLTHWFRNRWLIDEFLPVGHSTKRIMVGTDGIDPAKITVVHIGIPRDEIVTSPDARCAVRAELGVPADGVLIGNLARLVDFKGHTHLLDAMPDVLRAHPRTVCAIAGDGELREPLERQARALGIAGSLRFLGHRTDVPALLSAFDIYVQPSIDRGGETFPVAILSAMAAARPVVASDVGDIRYMVEDGGSGALLREKDAPGLAAALTALVGDAGLRSAMAGRGRALFEERFTLDVMTDRLEDAYYRVLSKRAGEGR